MQLKWSLGETRLYPFIKRPRILWMIYAKRVVDANICFHSLSNKKEKQTRLGRSLLYPHSCIWDMKTDLCDYILIVSLRHTMRQSLTQNQHTVFVIDYIHRKLIRISPQVNQHCVELHLRNALTCFMITRSSLKYTLYIWTDTVRVSAVHKHTFWCSIWGIHTKGQTHLRHTRHHHWCCIAKPALLNQPSVIFKISTEHYINRIYAYRIVLWCGLC